MSLKRFHVKRQTDEYHWSENDEFISINVDIKGVSMKHIDIFISDLYVKVNSTKVKFLMVFDLKNTIVVGHPKNRSTLANGHLDIRLVKSEPNTEWQTLEFAGTKAEKLERRKLSIVRFEEWDKQKSKIQDETKLKLDKAALDKQMEIEEYERKYIKTKKEEEKKIVEDKLYEDLEEMENLNEKLKQGMDPKLVQKEADELAHKSINRVDTRQTQESSKIKEINDDVEEKLPVQETVTEEAHKSEPKPKVSNNVYNDPSKNIFDDSDCVILQREQPKAKPKPKRGRPDDSDDEDVEPKSNEINSAKVQEITGEVPEDEKILSQFQSEPILSDYPDSSYNSGAVTEVVDSPEPVVKDEDLPKIREGGSKKLEFSEKVYPHMPARESHKKEAPFPKSKKKDDKKEEYIDIEDKDPVWLKDKGDHFYKRNDYNSAMNAYTKSIKNDPEFLKVYLNRATTLIKMCNFEGAILDLDDIETKVKNQPKEELEDPFYAKLMARTLIKRAAANTWISNFDEAEKDFKRALEEYKGIFTPEELDFIHSDLNKIDKRRQSYNFKVEGDKFYGQGDFDKALEHYEKALELDQTNEYALGNIGLVYLKRTDYQKCIEFTDKALSQMIFCSSYTRAGNTFADPTDNQLEIKLLLRRGKSYEMIRDYEKAKKDLDACIRLDRRNKEAATMLKKVQGHINDVLYQENKTEAERLFKDRKWNEALEYFERCLKITRKASTISNISVFVNKTACLLALDQIDTLLSECNNAIRLVKNFKVKDCTKEEKEKVKSMEIILLLRKGKAFLKKTEVKQAIEQFENALDLDPENESIKADIQKLKATN